MVKNISMIEPGQKVRGRNSPFLFLFIILLLSSISFAKGQSGSRSFNDVMYKRNTIGSALTLDIFLPDGDLTEKCPTVIIIHGGAWAEGDKTLDDIYYMRRLKNELLSNRFAVVSINYSLVGKDIHLPTPIEDCKDAVRWVRKHADEYNLDTLNIGLWGGSAGGHLALLTAYTTREQFTGDHTLASHSASVNYVIDNFGPTDLNGVFRMDMGWIPTFFARLFAHKIYDIREKLVFAMTGYHIKPDKQKIKELNTLYSPLSYINAHAVPTIIFHGTDDKIVPISQSQELKEELDKYSVKNEMITVNKGDHGFNNIPDSELNTLIDRSILFAKEQLK